MPVPGIPVAQPRRLRASDRAASGGATNSPPREALEGRRIRVRFTRGLPLIVDRPLIEMMMRHGMFAPVDDDLRLTHGPLIIQDFEVHDNGAVRADDESSDNDVEP